MGQSEESLNRLRTTNFKRALSTAAVSKMAIVLISLLALTVQNKNLIRVVWQWMILPSWNFALRVIGTMLGVGFGLGLATHVHDHLEIWHARERAKNSSGTSASRSITDSGITLMGSGNIINIGPDASIAAPIATPTNKNITMNSTLGSSTTLYASLMSSAGYEVALHHLEKNTKSTASRATRRPRHNKQQQQYIQRGQVIRSDSDFFSDINYPYTHIPEDRQQGPQIMQSTWPHLPKSVSHQLGRMIEFIVRDYIAVWYSMIDAGCPYRNEKNYRNEEQQKRKATNTNANQDKKEANDAAQTSTPPFNKMSMDHHSGRAMVWSTAIHRPIPLMNAMYHSLAIVFGNLSSRLEHVNVFSLLLLKWTKVVGHSFKVYRQLRHLALLKQVTNEKQTDQQRNNTPSYNLSMSATMVTAASSPRKSLNCDSNMVSRSTNFGSSHLSSATAAQDSRTSMCYVHSVSQDDAERPSSNIAPQTLQANSQQQETTTVPPSAPTSTAPAVTTTATKVCSEQGQRRRTEWQAVSEMAMAKEYLLAGKLHRAMTFGLDVPSLLFADALGRDCGVGNEDIDHTSANNGAIDSRVYSANDDTNDENLNSDNIDQRNQEQEQQQQQQQQQQDVHQLEEAILEQRLFSTQILKECEQDYNRVLASRLIRVLLPRSEYSSPIVRTVMIEMLANMVLSPIYGLFAPDYINTWIGMGVDKVMNKQEKNDSNVDDDTETATHTQQRDDDDVAKELVCQDDGDDGIGIRTDSDIGNQVKDPTNVNQGRGKENECGIGDDYKDNDAIQKNDSTGGNNDERVKDHDLDDGAAFNGGRRDSDLNDNENIDDELCEGKEEKMNGLTSFVTGEEVLPLVADAIVDLQRYLDFDKCREARDQNNEQEIDWDAPGCRDAVRHLVLVIEAALLHGCRRSRKVTVAPTKQRGTKRNSDNTCQGATTNGGNASGKNIVVVLLQDEMRTDKYAESVRENSLREHQTLSQVLMELTSDIDAFENRILQEEDDRLVATMASEEARSDDGSKSVFKDYDFSDVFKPPPSELSTFRTLIAAWLHSGQIYRTMSILSRAHSSVLLPFYRNHGLLRNENSGRDLLRQLKPLDGVDILVDTMAVLSSSSLNIKGNDSKILILKDQEMGGMHHNDHHKSQSGTVVFTDNVTSTTAAQTLRPQIIIQGSLDTREVVIPKTGLQTDALAAGSSLSKAGLSGSVRGLSGSVKDLKNNFSRLTNGLMGESAAGASSCRSVELSRRGTASAIALSQRFYAGSSNAARAYVDFNRNEAWALSLRSERERKLQSWADATVVREDCILEKMVIARTKELPEQDLLIYRDIHVLSQLFYTNTSIISIRSGMRRRQAEGSEGIPPKECPSTDDDKTHITLLAVEATCLRRRIEIPNDDSSFLLRAQARPLNPVGVHRDQRINNLSYKCFVATYNEPATFPGNPCYRGGRYIRRCLMRYFPSDRNVSISIPLELRRLDNRKDKITSKLHKPLERPATSILSGSFLRERHISKKWYPKGAKQRSSSILASSLMESGDFCAMPRSGKAIDFLYRVSLFELPIVELGGKKFTVHDSAAEGWHRADASALEISDASLSGALLVIGAEWREAVEEDDGDNDVVDTEGRPPAIEMGPDGYPIIWLKSKTNDSKQVKPYRTSYVRAALVISSTRQEAQLQCVARCIRDGSARNATKEQIESVLLPTYKLLEYASSHIQEKESTLLRDLKFGINHIDKDQLRRNGLLNPRYPTILQSLKAVVEGAIQAKDATVPMAGSTPNSMVYRVRCIATIKLVDLEEDNEELYHSYLSNDDPGAHLFREEWVVYRSYKDFMHLHKHLKTQVSTSETLAAQASTRRLVDAATAAFTHGGLQVAHRNRKVLIPSLGQANKSGALEFTTKVIKRRIVVLDEYLKHLLSPNHLMNRCPELLLFIGAFHPLPPEVRTGEGELSSSSDLLGRTGMLRTTMTEEVGPSVIVNKKTEKYNAISSSNSIKLAETEERSICKKFSSGNLAVMQLSNKNQGVRDNSSSKKKSTTKSIPIYPSIKAKIDKVPLGQVRRSIFELVRYQFDFDNASFIRSRMFSAIQTMSFAVTSSTEFRKMLYKAHLKHINPNELSAWLKLLVDMLWPGGILFDSKPALTPEENKALADKTIEKLLVIFPDQLQSILGQEITKDGLELLHAMLQNRLVLKSMAYMLFDLLWLAAFPELQDILTGGSVLDMD